MFVCSVCIIPDVRKLVKEMDADLLIFPLIPLYIPPKLRYNDCIRSVLEEIMFREMRRHAQLLSEEETALILKSASSGVLAVAGDDGYPYAVPLSYVYDGEYIYFHCAVTGHKIDAIRQNPKVSFCVIAKDDILPEKFTTQFASVIVFGKAEILTDKEEKIAALRLLAEKYSPGADGAEREISGSLDRTGVVKIVVEHMTGKEAIELTRQRKNNQ